jgi:hypothetical protein
MSWRLSGICKSQILNCNIYTLNSLKYFTCCLISHSRLWKNRLVFMPRLFFNHYLFCSLFNDDFNSSKCIALNSRTASEVLSGKAVEGSDRGLFKRSIRNSFRSTEENYRKPHRRYSVPRLRFEPGTSRIQVRRFAT